jgi:hypothetical protein
MKSKEGQTMWHVDPALSDTYIQSDRPRPLPSSALTVKERTDSREETTNEMVADSDYNDEDGGFEFYEVTTTDPGPAMLVCTIIISILLYAMLPFMVACGERRDRKRRAWEYKNRVEQQEVGAPGESGGGFAGGDDGTDTNRPAREKLMKNGVHLRQRKNSIADKDPAMDGIVRQKPNVGTVARSILVILTLPSIFDNTETLGLVGTRVHRGDHTRHMLACKSSF